MTVTFVAWWWESLWRGLVALGLLSVALSILLGVAYAVPWLWRWRRLRRYWFPVYLTIPAVQRHFIRAWGKLPPYQARPHFERARDVLADHGGRKRYRLLMAWLDERLGPP